MNKVENMNKMEKLVLDTLRTSGNSRIFRDELAFAQKLIKKEGCNIDLKKIVKKAYKNNIYFGESSVNKKVVNTLKSYPIINFGTYYYKWQDGSCDYDSWTNWYIIETPNDLKDEDEMINYAKRVIANILGEDELEEDRITSPYDCTGEVFSYEMDFIIVGKNRVLAKKYFGRDV